MSRNTPWIRSRPAAIGATVISGKHFHDRVDTDLPCSMLVWRNEEKLVKGARSEAVRNCNGNKAFTWHIDEENT